MTERFFSRGKKKLSLDPGKILILIFVFVLIVFVFAYNFSNQNALDRQGFSCTDDSQCNDDNPCTIDECSSKTGICYNSEKSCASGEFCNESNGECELLVVHSGESGDAEADSDEEQNSEDEDEVDDPNQESSEEGTNEIPPPPSLPN